MCFFRHPTAVLLRNVSNVRVPWTDSLKPLISGEFSSVQNPCYLMIMGDYTTQYIENNHNIISNPIWESLLTNQYNVHCVPFWEDKTLKIPWEIPASKLHPKYSARLVNNAGFKNFEINESLGSSLTLSSFFQCNQVQKHWVHWLRFLTSLDIFKSYCCSMQFCAILIPERSVLLLPVKSMKGCLLQITNVSFTTHGFSNLWVTTILGLAGRLICIVIPTMWGPQTIAFSWFITPMTMVYDTYNYILNLVYKPTNITGEPHPVESFLGRT